MGYILVFLFKESGRLGNQLFQYAALKTLCPKDKKLVLLGFESLQSVFDGISATTINSTSPRFERSFYYRLYGYANSWPQKQWFSRLKESKSQPKIINSPGFSSQLSFIEESYFQSESFFTPEAIQSLYLKPKLLSQAQELLKVLVSDKIPIFIHIRRGDYLTWPSKEHPAVLPASYYHECMSCIKANIPNVFWLFTSDDSFYVRDVFGDVEDSYISQGSSFEDFALMTQCQSGILSASSFSWWAAYFAHLRYPNGKFLAPRYWAGHRSGLWYPNFIKASFLHYIAV